MVIIDVKHPKDIFHLHKKGSLIVALPNDDQISGDEQVNTKIKGE